MIDQGKGQNYIYILNNNNFVMTYDFYVLLKFITQHKFNIKLPVDNNGK